MGWAKIAILCQYLAPSHAVNGSMPSAIHAAATDRQVDDTSRSKRQRLFFTGDDEVFMTRSLNGRRRQQSSICLHAVINLKPN